MKQQGHRFSRGRRQGPTLPGRLQRQVAEPSNDGSAQQPGSGKGGRQRGSMFAVSRRKVARKQDRLARKQRRAATFSGKPSPRQAARSVQPGKQKQQVTTPVLKRSAPLDSAVSFL